MEKKYTEKQLEAAELVTRMMTEAPDGVDKNAILFASAFIDGFVTGSAMMDQKENTEEALAG